MLSGEYLIDKFGQLRAHNFGFKGDTVYVAADRGLWSSHDRGLTWNPVAPIQTIIDNSTGESFEEVDFFSVTPIGDSLWVGTDEGIAVRWVDAGTSDFVWRIHRAHKPAGVDGEMQTYAYPNPFSPKRGHITRIQVPAYSSSLASFKVFNFAMESVFTSTVVTLQGDGAGDMEGYGALKWNGRDKAGNFVANGVYFYKVSVGNDSWWGKIMVLD